MQPFTPTAHVVAHSVNDAGNHLATVRVELHRLAMLELVHQHSEMVITWNDALQQPTGDVIEAVTERPAMPLFWPTAAISAHASPPMPSSRAYAAKQTWLRSRDEALACVSTIQQMGAHHTVVNRLLEPWMTQVVLITGTEWRAFFDKRTGSYENPLVNAELNAAAEVIGKALRDSKPEPLTLGQWHLPFVQDWELQTRPVEQAIEISAARCSFAATPDEDDLHSIQSDLDQYRSLRRNRQLGPMRHICTPAERGERTPALLGWFQLPHYRRFP